MSERFKAVLIACDVNPVPEWVLRKFADAGINFVQQECYSREDLAQCATDADLLWLMSSRGGLVVEANMDLFPKVGVVIKHGSGTDNIDHEACRARGIIVAHSPEDPTDSTSDHTIAMLFSAVRQTAHQDRLVRAGKWDMRLALPVGHFMHADLGVIGFGRIARLTVKKLRGFEMTVRVFDPYVDAETIAAAGAQKVGLEELLRESQFVLVACPLTEQTRGLIGEEELRAMRRDATLVNCARGGIVDEAALARALRERWIAAAAVDVLTTRPLPADSPFHEIGNLVLTPHMGGCPDDYPDGVYRTQVEEILRIARGEMPRWIANRGVVPKWDLR